MSTPHMLRTSILAVGTLGVLLASSRAGAVDLGVRDPAARLGLSLNPDQVHAGIQAHVGPVKSVRFRPSLDVGVGNGVRLASINADLLFRGRQGRSPLFVGGGRESTSSTSPAASARAVEWRRRWSSTASPD